MSRTYCYLLHHAEASCYFVLVLAIHYYHNVTLKPFIEKRINDKIQFACPLSFHFIDV